MASWRSSGTREFTRTLRGIDHAALIILFSSSSVAQIAAIALGAVLGSLLSRTSVTAAVGGHLTLPVSKRAGLASLAAFFLILAALPILRALAPSRGVARFEAFYRLTTRPSCTSSLCRRFIHGNDSRQGAHQEAQKSR